jgi:carboxyl-terminal processing protease
VKSLLSHTGTLSALALATVLVACAERAPDLRTAPIDSELAIATFDSAWAIVHRTHFDPEFEVVDWIAVREELRPRAFEVQTHQELRMLLNEMIGRTGLSHFGVIEQDAVDALRTDGETGDAEPGISVRLVGDDLLVWKVRTGSPAALAGVAPGWRLVRVGERDLVEAVARSREHEEGERLELLVWSFAETLLRGAPGSEVELTLLDEDEGVHDLLLVRETGPGVLNQFGNLPPMRANTAHELVEYDGLRVGVISFNIWLVPVMAEFERALDLYRDADGLILDLRGNIGGLGAMAMGMAGHLIDEKVTLGVMRTRSTSLDFRVNPRITNAKGERVQPYAGPLAILQDPMSMSTSEIFAQGLQTLGRARVFGETSGGAALPSQLTRLPSGDVLQHAFADFVDPEGTRLEGRGVIPDVYVPLARADLLAGRDEPKAAALRWIAEQARSR